MQGIVFVSSEQEKKDFLEFPYHHYNNDPQWVPPLKIQQKALLDTQKNPFFKTADIALFLASHNGEIAGRIAAIHNHAYNDYHKDTAGFFGFFECVKHQNIANLLFRVVKDWLQDRGCTRLLGPMNPGLLDEIGIQIDGFQHAPAIMMPHSKPWYDRLILDAGLEKAMDLFSYKVTQNKVETERMNRAVEIVKKRTPGLEIRPVRIRKLDEEVKIVHHIFNRAWNKNWGFYEIGLDFFEHLAKDLKQIIDPDFAHIAEVNGKPVAFSIALPDYNQVFKKMNGNLFPFGFLKLLWYRKKINGIRTSLMGVLPEYHGRGIDALLTREAINNGIKRNFQTAELGWLLETNTDVIRVAERVGGVKEKTYRIYQKKF